LACSSSVTNPSATSASPILWIGDEWPDFNIASSVTGTREPSSVQLAEKEPAEARKAFEKSAEIAPDYLPPTEELVNLDIAEKQYAAALERARRLIERDPKVAQAWGLRGKIYFAQGDFARAEPDLLKAVELDPQLEPAYLLLARGYVASNKQDEAVAKLNAFVEQRKDVPALAQLAAIQKQLKNYPAARAAYEQLLEVSPNSVAALNDLAVLYSEQFGDPGKALDFAKKARDLAPNMPQVADTLGWVLFRKGDYGSALPLLLEAAGKPPTPPEVEFHLGMTRYMLGQEEPARAALQNAVDAAVDFPGQEEARARLALLAVKPGTAGAGTRADIENYLRGSRTTPPRWRALQHLRSATESRTRRSRPTRRSLPTIRSMRLPFGSSPCSMPHSRQMSTSRNPMILRSRHSRHIREIRNSSRRSASRPIGARSTPEPSNSSRKLPPNSRTTPGSSIISVKRTTSSRIGTGARRPSNRPSACGFRRRSPRRQCAPSQSATKIFRPDRRAQ
jgi:tetratricopeptide (TPR) repeat protein